MTTELRNKLYVLGQTVAGLSITNFYYMVVPQNKTYPYAVYFEIIDSGSRDSETEFSDIPLQVSFYSKDLDEIETIAKAFRKKFNRGQNLFTGLVENLVYGMVFQFSKKARLNKVYQIDQQYLIQAEILI